MSNTSWNMYAHKYESNGKSWFAHVGDKKWVELHLLKDPIIPVKVVIDEKGSYYGWLENGKNKPCMIYHAKRLLDMCFPNGTKAEEQRGRGKVIRLSVKERIG